MHKGGGPAMRYTVLALLLVVGHVSAEEDPLRWQTYARVGLEHNEEGGFTRVSFNQNPWDIEGWYNLDTQETERIDVGFVCYGAKTPDDTVSGWLVGVEILYPERASRLASEYCRYDRKIGAEFYLQLKFRNIGARARRIPLRLLMPLAVETVFDKPLHWSARIEDAEPFGSWWLDKTRFAPRVNVGYETSGRWTSSYGLSLARGCLLGTVMSDGFSISLGTGLNENSPNPGPPAF